MLLFDGQIKEIHCSSLFLKEIIDVIVIG